MLRRIKRSISNKLMLVVLLTTFIALLAYGVVMLAYDIRSYHDNVVKDLATQANIIAEISAPALEFNDPITAQENLELLRTRPSILRAAIYSADGAKVADYTSATKQQQEWPDVVPATLSDYLVEGNRITVWRRVVKDQQILGTVYIRARYEVNARLFDYAFILACVMGASLGLATLFAIWLRGAVTKPIFAVTNVARQVMQSRDFSLRAEKFTEDEIGVLVEAFNDMLSEVERRASALEASNRSLEHEMAERQMAEDALRLADRRKDEFLATLAHELRNPLAPLLNGLHILRASKDTPATTAAAQAVMERQLKQMVRLVDDLLDVSRITTGKLTISKSRVDIQSIMRDAIESSGSFIEACGHQLTVHMPSTPLYVDGDSIRLAQVFSNLLNNAAKYTNSGGNITFSARADNQQVRVDVADDGIGIAPEMLSDIFDMFTQVDYSLERTHAGLGVGLALSKHLIELHGGKLQVVSEGTGRGSTFIVQLDRVEPEATAVDAPGQKPTPNTSHRVLLVDDNIDYVTTMAELLTTLGHNVRTAYDGASGLEVAREFSPDFAFLDIGMPGLNGYEVARQLRQSRDSQRLVLTAVTGWGQEKDRQMSRSAGFDHHLVKPVELAELLAVLEGSVT